MKPKINYFFKEHYFILLIIATSFACAFYYQNYFVLLINLIILFFIKFKPFDWRKFLFIFCFFAIIIMLCFVVDTSFKTKNIIDWFEDKIPFSFRKLFFNFLDQKYLNQNTNAFLKLLIFNQKTKTEWLKEIYNINIAHLFIVSGLHLNIFIVIFEKIFKNPKFTKVKITITILFLFLYGYFLNFNVGFLRVFITYLLKLKKRPFSKNDNLSISGLIIALISFYNVAEFAFVISYLCLYTINLVNCFRIENKTFKTLIVSIMIFLFSFPFSFYFNAKLNILGIVFGYIFGLPLILLHQFIFWFMLIPKFEIALDFIVKQILFSINKINKIDAFIYISQILKKYIWIYFLGYSSIFMFVYYKKI